MTVKEMARLVVAERLIAGEITVKGAGSRLFRASKACPLLSCNI